jgi:hypothetical protein
MEILWAFSIYLEAIGILPQLFMLQRTGEAETITTHYLFALGAYRALYVPNWVYRCTSFLPQINQFTHTTLNVAGTSLRIPSTPSPSSLDSCRRPCSPISSTFISQSEFPRPLPPSITDHIDCRVMRGQKFELPVCHAVLTPARRVLTRLSLRHEQMKW